MGDCEQGEPALWDCDFFSLYKVTSEPRAPKLLCSQGGVEEDEWMGWRLCPDVSCASSAFPLVICPEQGSLKESRAGEGVQLSSRHRQG